MSEDGASIHLNFARVTKRNLGPDDYREAFAWAMKIPRLSVYQALTLTEMAAEHDPERFQSMARRWLCLWIEAKHPPVEETAKVAQALADLLDPDRADDAARELLMATGGC